MAQPVAVEAFVDLDRYPVDAPGSPGHAAMMAGLHAALERDGCAVLKGFGGAFVRDFLAFAYADLQLHNTAVIEIHHQGNQRHAFAPNGLPQAG